MAAEWSVGDTMTPAVGRAVQPPGETAATSKGRLGWVLAAAELAVAVRCLGVGGTWDLGLSSLQRPWGGLNRRRGTGSSGVGMIRGWTGSPLGSHRCLRQPGGWCVFGSSGHCNACFGEAPKPVHTVCQPSSGAELNQGWGGGGRGVDNPPKPLRCRHRFCRASAYRNRLCP